jgi:hypothetical protein
MKRSLDQGASAASAAPVAGMSRQSSVASEISATGPLEVQLFLLMKIILICYSHISHEI